MGVVCSNMNHSEAQTDKTKKNVKTVKNPAEQKMVSNDRGRSGITVSAEGLVEPEKPGGETEDTEEDCTLSANRIQIIETNFDQPRKSSFRASEKLESAATSVRISDDLAFVDVEHQEEADSGDVQHIELTEEELVNLNVGLRAKIRHDSLDKTPTKTQ